jgi:hypothetical protein
MQNVCRRPSDRLLGILARLFLEPKFPHTNLSISSHLPVTGFTVTGFIVTGFIVTGFICHRVY